MNYNPSETEFACRIISATPEDVSQAYYDLKRDMNPDFVHVFLDKIQRYALKPDRALFWPHINILLLLLEPLLTTLHRLKTSTSQQLTSLIATPAPPDLWSFLNIAKKGSLHKLLSSGNSGHAEKTFQGYG